MKLRGRRGFGDLKDIIIIVAIILLLLLIGISVKDALFSSFDNVASTVGGGVSP